MFFSLAVLFTVPSLSLFFFVVVVAAGSVVCVAFVVGLATLRIPAWPMPGCPRSMGNSRCAIRQCTLAFWYDWKFSQIYPKSFLLPQYFFSTAHPKCMNMHFFNFHFF